MENKDKPEQNFDSAGHTESYATNSHINPIHHHTKRNASLSKVKTKGFQEKLAGEKPGADLGRY